VGEGRRSGDGSHYIVWHYCGRVMGCGEHGGGVAWVTVRSVVFIELLDSTNPGKGGDLRGLASLLRNSGIDHAIFLFLRI
jgi:hypothetical protein